MCKHLKVSASGYYDWHGRVPSRRAAANGTLLVQIEAAHFKSDSTYGMPRRLKVSKWLSTLTRCATNP